MSTGISRRDFLKLAGVAGAGGVAWAVGVSIPGCSRQAGGPAGGAGGFNFVQLSDTHWGFSDPAINPDFAGTLKKAVAAVNALPVPPDFIVFTGDLTHTTDDDKVRRERMAGFRRIIKDLKVQDIRFLPGEHDASLDEGAAFKEFFGQTRYTFDHKGVHFIVLDNVSDPRALLGDAQLQWLAEDLKKHGTDERIIVLTHRPLFDLAPDWDWSTRDGARAIELLSPYASAVVLYGHIHQINDHATGRVVHHAAMGLMYPLPAPHSVPKKAPIPWDAAHPYRNLGYREVREKEGAAGPELVNSPLAAEGGADPQVIKITAKKFEYSPSEITLKKDAPVTLELTSMDRLHGFNCPDLSIRADIEPGKTARITFTPRKAGRFVFHCDIFCGSGHDKMAGAIVVTE